jgi:hypothetical protein
MPKNITLVLLPKNDDDKQMSGMRAAIRDTLASHQHVVSMLDQPDMTGFPGAPQDEVWLCGHCRFVEANMSFRKFADRNLGGYTLPVIADFLNSCILYKNVKTIRLICCESAQKNASQPGRGVPTPAPLDKDLGETNSIALQAATFNAWPALPAQNISQLEQLLVYMKMSYDSKGGPKVKSPFPAFEIVGLWGAGDVEKDKPITSFLQQGGGLEVEEKARNNPQNGKMQSDFAALHCTAKGLPDLFGYQVQKDFFNSVNPIKGDPFKG